MIRWRDTCKSISQSVSEVKAMPAHSVTRSKPSQLDQIGVEERSGCVFCTVVVAVAPSLAQERSQRCGVHTVQWILLQELQRYSVWIGEERDAEDCSWCMHCSSPLLLLPFLSCSDLLIQTLLLVNAPVQSHDKPSLLFHPPLRYRQNFNATSCFCSFLSFCCLTSSCRLSCRCHQESR